MGFIINIKKAVSTMIMNLQLVYIIKIEKPVTEEKYFY